ncbi:uncharacterized protein BO80DRAFT_434265 [Aspergillus ibericus CBS 121593]|uniref:Uncharacterized protein n=1 Tax=Aspergillus ibericus CBS 121593 TaxID=1448316 RepID=A0A395H266_9EURO|nr:hypothetical protein BO80DRAFT_434265 [Aspergillus ibericus CBS 121593]RAL01710.1 hypothetical protein BO80DRAFT_434265 [Aspergillus ibericus CBS 121593]
MASGPSSILNVIAFSEPTNGAGHVAKSSLATEPVKDIEPTPSSNFDEAKHTSETTSAQQISDTANAVPKESAGEPRVGNKRAYEPTSPPVDADRTGTEKATEPAPKRQNTDAEDARAPHGPSAPTAAKNTKRGQATNRDNKKGGRPKKAKATVKRDLPTDGIGSRTRSRTKIAS